MSCMFKNPSSLHDGLPYVFGFVHKKKHFVIFSHVSINLNTNRPWPIECTNIRVFRSVPSANALVKGSRTEPAQ